ncbi:MAG: hypothetical protein KY476_21980 [Planctomycetes bacterium]|nr:hypothetical protein [Planctomycetota bacterium]
MSWRYDDEGRRSRRDLIEAPDDNDARAPSPSLPAGHPPVAASASAAAEVIRTGPYRKDFPQAGLTFSIPAGWKEQKLAAGSFVDAQFAVPAGEDELRMTMSLTGGGIEANVERWLGQFDTNPDRPPVVEPMQIGGAQARWIDVEGRFTAPSFMASSGDHSDWAMLAAAIPRDGGRDFYVRLSGPRAAVDRIRQSFRDFLAETTAQ